MVGERLKRLEMEKPVCMHCSDLKVCQAGLLTAAWGEQYKQPVICNHEQEDLNAGSHPLGMRQTCLSHSDACSA